MKGFHIIFFVDGYTQFELASMHDPIFTPEHNNHDHFLISFSSLWTFRSRKLAACSVNHPIQRHTRLKLIEHDQIFSSFAH